MSPPDLIAILRKLTHPMARQDNLEFSGDMILYRRVPNFGGHATWDESGKPTPSNQNFRDQDDELSMYIAAETTPEKALKGNLGFGLIWITAGYIRSICIDPKGTSVIQICRDERDPDDGHILICGRITGGMRKSLSKKSQWVDGYLPTRIVSSA